MRIRRGPAAVCGEPGSSGRALFSGHWVSGPGKVAAFGVRAVSQETRRALQIRSLFEEGVGTMRDTGLRNAFRKSLRTITRTSWGFRVREVKHIANRILSVGPDLGG